MHLLLIVDQFEELFTLCRSEDERAAFLDNLLTAAQAGGPTCVVVVLRADFYEHCIQYPRLRASVSARQELIGPMDADEIRSAIEQPLQRNGWELEAGLVALILRDIGASANRPPEPGALPLLSHALLETWKRRQGRKLTLAGYAEAGGVRGAIAQTAEAVYRRQTPEGQAVARAVFLRLTELGEGTQDTRRRARLEELYGLGVEESGQAVGREFIQGVLHMLADARLVTMTADSVEVAHEALIREWPSLRGWLEEDRDGLRVHRRLTEAAAEWERSGFEAGELYRGARLAQAQEWVRGGRAALSSLEAKFLSASQQALEHEILEKEAQQRRELAQAQRLARTQRQRALVLAVGLVVAILLGLLSFGFYRQSSDRLRSARAANTQVAASAATAQANARIGSGRSAIAEAQRMRSEKDPHVDQSGLLAVEGLRRVPETDWTAKQAARKALSVLGRPIASMAHEDEVISVAFSPDGRWVASGSYNGTIKVWDAASGVEISHMQHDSSVIRLAFGPDRRTVVSASSDGTARVWQADTGIEVARMTHDDVVNDVAFSPDGRWVISGSNDTTARVWKSDSGEEISRMTHGGYVRMVAFSLDGRWIVSGGDDNARVWEAETGKEVSFRTGNIATVALSPDGRRAMELNRDGWNVIVWDVSTGTNVNAWDIELTIGIKSAEFSPDGRWLVVTGNIGGKAEVWDVNNVKVISRFSQGTAITSLAFSPDGRWIVSGGDDNASRVWETATGSEVSAMIHEGPVSSVAFSPDGRRVVSGSEDGTARVWEVADTAEVAQMKQVMYVTGAAFSPDGKLVVSGSWDTTARVWQVATGEEITRVMHGGMVTAVAFSPDGQAAASGSSDGVARVWQPGTSAEITQVSHPGSVTGLAFSPDGRRVVSGSSAGTAWVWNATTGDEISHKQHPDKVTAVAFSADGRRVASGAGNSVYVWEAADGSEVLRKEQDAEVTSVAFSPDGRWMASGSGDHAQVWQVDTGEEIASFLHNARVTSVAFSPDGRWVVSGSLDGNIVIWEAAGGNKVDLIQQGGPVSAAAFSPDGRRVLSGGCNDFGDPLGHEFCLKGIVHVWMWGSQDLMAELCARLTRNFTPVEWSQYFGDDTFRRTCENLPEGK